MANSTPSLTQARRLPEVSALHLEWSDGYNAEPTYRYLCGYCPCAGCQGHIGKVEYKDPGRDPELALGAQYPSGLIFISCYPSTQIGLDHAIPGHSSGSCVTRA